MLFTEAYIKNIFVKLIFKTFVLENSKEKGSNILLRPGICSLCLLLRSAHLAKTFFSVQTNCLLHCLCGKKKLTTKRFNLTQNQSPLENCMSSQIQTNIQENWSSLISLLCIHTNFYFVTVLT